MRRIGAGTVTSAVMMESCSPQRPSQVVAGLVPATPVILALRLHVRGRRDKPGDDADW
jgi:hypothetical protein